jgi:glycosyltransferase involved in cell wall biosynthesis
VRIDQFLPGFAKYDAIGNHALQLRRVLRQAGYTSDIFGEVIDPRLGREGRHYLDCPQEPDPDRLLLYHASTDSRMVDWLQTAAGRGQRIAVDYHNVTPSRYYARWEPPAAQSMYRARQEVASLASVAGLAVADSAYNEAELITWGYHPTAVCHLLVDLDAYHREPDPKTLRRLRRLRDRGGHRWLFVGRMAPNKCQHDVIAAFAVYRRLYDPLAELTLVGGGTSPRYRRALEQMAAELELGDSVVWREALPFPQLLAYFATADLFVCLSEHEGFCVPILEAMELGVPVIAYRAAAVTDTVDKAGVLLDDKDPLTVASAANQVMADENRRLALVEAGRHRAADFALDLTSKQFLDTIEAWLSGQLA